jgi:precorrin-6B methylase 2
MDLGAGPATITLTAALTLPNTRNITIDNNNNDLCI